MRIAPIIAGLVLCCAPLAAQFADNFETLPATAAGTPVNGINGYYIPPVASSNDASAYTYAGNALGIPPHPSGGGANFVGGQNVGGAFNVRTQHPVAYGPSPYTSGVWNLTLDFCARFNGTVFPAVSNIASVSPQPSTTCRHFIMLATWNVPIPAAAAPTKWNADFAYFNPVSPGITQIIAGSAVPSTLPSCFQGLDVDVWYRWSVTWDWALNRVLEVSIQNLNTGVRAFHRPPDWYLRGGPANVGASTDPTDFRMFVGGATAGNAAAFDNVSITPGIAPAGLAQYQVNQPGIATCDINGVAGTAFCPAVITSSFAAATALSLNLNAGAYDMAYGLGAALPASDPNAIVLPDGQVFSLNLVTCSWLSGALPTPAFAGPLALGFAAPPPGLVITAQVVAFGVGPLGLGLSQPMTLVTGP